MSISRKLLAMMMAAAALALVLAAGGFTFLDYLTFRAKTERDLATLAEVIASNSTASLTFGDREAAAEILSALRAKPAVISATLFDRTGKPFAVWNRRQKVKAGRIEVVREVVLDGQRIGVLRIVANDDSLLQRLGQYAIIAACILVLSLVAAFVLSTRLQRFISAPIGDLARVAHEVTLNRNYAARVTGASTSPRNEIEKLIVAFNQMLAEIQRRDDELEEQVQRRTRELRAVNAKLLLARDSAEMAAEAHAEISRRKQMILNSAAEGIFGLDATGITTFVNPSAAQMLGLPSEQIVGVRLHDLLHPKDRVQVPLGQCAVCSSELQPPVRTSKRDTFVHRSGKEIPVELTASTIFDVPGHASGVVVTFRDISERLAIDRMKDEFVSTVSHELRTPLTSIRGALGLLGSGRIGPIDSRAQRMLDIAVSNTDRLVRLINDILDLERIHSGRVELKRTDIDAADLMAEAAEGIQAFAERAGIRLVVEPLHEIVRADRDRIIQTLTNLLSNAIKFSPRDAMVRLTGCAGRDELTFIVTDQGRGIPAEHLESIFERFRQVDASDSRRKGGTGLGLAISRSIVHAHGGSIRAESREGKGSTFRFTIPLAARREPHMPTSSARTVVVFGKTAIAATLEHSGFHVLTAESLTELRRVTECEQPDVILIDAAAPAESLWRFIGELKANDATRHIPIVAAAGSVPISRERCDDMIASWLPKRCSDGDVVDAICAVCEQRTVLVVEDDVDLARVITSSLEARGLHTRHAVTGMDAIAICETEVPRVIVLDLVLPELDGFQVVEWMRSRSALAHTPLLVYSAQEVSDADQERLRLGPTEFLTKSRVSLAQFEQRVIRLLHEVTSATAA